MVDQMDPVTRRSSPGGRDDFRVGQTLRCSTGDRTYEVLQVRKGGFGAVYVARLGADGNLYALKTFQARYLWSDEDRERFEREATTWVMLDRHPNIVTAHWAERIEGFPCLVLEYVTGGDLAQLLRDGPLPPDRAVELALQFCDGLAYAHGRLGIVHRDVKPSNCLLAADGTLKITDFGLARAFGALPVDGLRLPGTATAADTQFTTVAGTPQYMAPEQFRAGARLDTRTDIYAFGVMLYEMVTGNLPPAGGVAESHVKEHAGLDKLPRDLLRLIQWCTEREPDMRPGGMEAVRQALVMVYGVVTGRTAPSPAEPPTMGAFEWNNKGMALYVLGRSEEAVSCFDRGLKLAPDYGNLWNNKGTALLALARPREAVACYAKGLEVTPLDKDLWAGQGAALQALGRYSEALDCYNRGLEIAPKDSHLWKSKGDTLDCLGQHEEALACYDRALQIAPREPDLWNNKGISLAAMGRYEDALACYERALDISPRGENLWYGKGNALGFLGRFEDALDCYDRGLEIDPAYGGLWCERGLALRALGRHEEALASYDKGLDIAPGEPALWNNKGNALAGLGRLEEALACFNEGLKIAPSDIGLWNNRGMALNALDRIAEAEASFRRAQQLRSG